MVSHSKKGSSRVQRFIVNTFGALGYTSIILQWLWLAVAYVPYLIDSPLKDFFLPPEAPKENAAPIIAISAPTLPSMIIAGVITVIMIIVTIYVFIKAPTAVGKTGHKVTQSTAKALVPVVTKHRPIKKEKRRILTQRIILILKATLVVIPLLGALPVSLLDKIPLEYSIYLIVGVAVASASFVLFALQYMFAKLFKLKFEQIW